MELSPSQTYIAEPQPLADALQKSRDLRKRKQQGSVAWLAAREVVKRPRIKKPTGFKEPTYELKKKGPGQGFRSDLQGKKKERKSKAKRSLETKARLGAQRAEKKAKKESGAIPHCNNAQCRLYKKPVAPRSRCQKCLRHLVY